MRYAYVGLVGPAGLEALLPENQATRRWAVAAATKRRQACLWAVMPERAALELDALLADNEPATALQYLLEQADSFGPVM